MIVRMTRPEEDSACWTCSRCGHHYPDRLYRIRKARDPKDHGQVMKKILTRIA